MASLCGKLFCRLGCVCDSINAGVPLLDHCQHPKCMFQCNCSFSDSEQESFLSYSSPPKAKMNAEMVATPRSINRLRLQDGSKRKLCRVFVQPENKGPYTLKLSDPQCIKPTVLNSTRQSPRTAFKRSRAITNELVEDSEEKKPVPLIFVDKKLILDKKLFQNCFVRLKRMKLCNIVSEEPEPVPFKDPKLSIKTSVLVEKLRIHSTVQKVFCLDHNVIRCSCMKVNTSNLRTRNAIKNRSSFKKNWILI